MLAAMHANKDTDFATAAEFVGADPRTAPKDWAPAQHEKIAKAWEMYLREGKTAIPALKNLFEKFKTFLTAVYKTVVGNDFIGPDGKQITLTPEVRQMFEGWLSAESRYDIGGLREAAAKLGMNTKGMTDAQVEAAYEGAKAKRSEEKSVVAQLLDIAGAEGYGNALISNGEQSRIWDKEKRNLLLGLIKKDSPFIQGTAEMFRKATAGLKPDKKNSKLFQTRTVDSEAEVPNVEQQLLNNLAAQNIVPDKAININLRKLTTEDDAKRVIETMDTIALDSAVNWLFLSLQIKHIFVLLE
jgi:hypothetical protein